MSFAIDRFGSIFVQLYAQGESLMTITILRPEDHTPELLTSAGRARVGIEVQIVDADGWLYLLDRAKDMIISGGSNVYARGGPVGRDV